MSVDLPNCTNCGEVAPAEWGEYHHVSRSVTFECECGRLRTVPLTEGQVTEALKHLLMEVSD